MIFRVVIISALTATKPTWATQLCTPTWKISTQKDPMDSPWSVLTQDVEEEDQKRIQTCTRWTWRKTSPDLKGRVWSTQLLNYFTPLLTRQGVRPKLRRDSNKYTPRSTSGNFSSKRTSLQPKNRTKMVTKRTVSSRMKVPITTQKQKIKTTRTMNHKRKSGAASQSLSMRIRQRSKKSNRTSRKKTIRRPWTRSRTKKRCLRDRTNTWTTRYLKFFKFTHEKWKRWPLKTNFLIIRPSRQHKRHH
jgi:hypothetical protein